MSAPASAALGFGLGDVLDTLTVAETDEAFARLTHAPGKTSLRLSSAQVSYQGILSLYRMLLDSRFAGE